MKIGIISDTHDNLLQIKKAVTLFNREKVDLVLHAGDFTSPFTALGFKNLHSPFIGVFGNNDGDKLYLREKFKEIGKIFPPPYISLLNDQRTIMLHREKLIDALIESRKYNIIIYGHTHHVDLRKINNSLVINPGECGGWLTGVSTVALLQIKDLSAKIINLENNSIISSI